MPSSVPRYVGLTPASARASDAARASSRKRDTRAEQTLRRALWARGLRYRIDAADLPGRPDLVFRAARVVVFCDGDFWHGRDLAVRLEKLARGHNAPYWVAKISRNVQRDREQSQRLSELGWLVLRYWETDIDRSSDAIADAIVTTVRHRQSRRLLRSQGDG